MSSDHIKPYYRTIRPGGEAIDSIIPLVYTRSFRVEHFPVSYTHLFDARYIHAQFDKKEQGNDVQDYR